MVDIVVKIIWYRVCETAEKVLGNFNTDASNAMDPLGLLLLGWIVLAGVVYFATDHIKDLLTRFAGDVQPVGPAGRINATPPASRPVAIRVQDTTTSRFPASSASEQQPQQQPLLQQQQQYRGDALATSGGLSSPSQQPSETLQARVKLINYSEEGSDWVNSVLNWLYHRYNTTPEFADIWLSALNEHAKRNAQQLGILVTFDRFLPTSCAPRIGDVRAELAADEQMSIFCSVETIQLGFHLLATVTDERGLVNTNSYDVDIDQGQEEIRFLNINDLRQLQPTQLHTNQCFQLKMLIYMSQHNELLLSGEFEKHPHEVLVRVRSPGRATPVPDDHDTGLVQNAVKQCIQNAVTTMRLARFRDFPFPSWHSPSTSSNSKPSSPTYNKEPSQTHFPFPATLSNGPKINPFRNGNYQVVVRVIRASAVGDDAGMEPYCVIEMDEPPQKHTTTVAKVNGSNPVWEEKFTLDVSPDSSEMLFELYDRTKPQKKNFLGTAIVSLHELQKNPTQRQIIPLQSRPLMDDSVSGSLTLEFSVLAGGVPLSSNILDVSAQGKSATLPRAAAKASRDNHVYANGVELSELAGGEFPPGHFLPGTSRVPAVQRSHSEDIPLSSSGSGNSHKPKRKLSATDGHLGDSDGSSADYTDGKGRKRKTSFLGRIKRRFSFGKKRSKSLDPAVAKEEMRQVAANAAAVASNGTQTHFDQSTPEPNDVDTELLLAVERGRSRKQDRQSQKEQKRSKSAPGSREPSATRSTASAFGGITPPLGVMHDDERLHNSLVFLLSTTGNKSTRATWRDKLRSRFSKSTDRASSTIITTQEVA